MFIKKKNNIHNHSTDNNTKPNSDKTNTGWHYYFSNATSLIL